MSVRGWMNDNPAVATIIAVVALAVAIIVVFWTGSRGTPHGPADVYFVDQNTGNIFVGTSNERAPIRAPSDGPGQASGLRVHIYSCDECPRDLRGRNIDEMTGPDLYVAYLERYTEEALEVLRDMSDPGNGDIPPDHYLEIENAHEVRAPDGTTWALRDTPEAGTIMQRRTEHCNRPNYCRPH